MLFPTFIGYLPGDFLNLLFAFGVSKLFCSSNYFSRVVCRAIVCLARMRALRASGIRCLGSWLAFNSWPPIDCLADYKKVLSRSARCLNAWFYSYTMSNSFTLVQLDFSLILQALKSAGFVS